MAKEIRFDTELFEQMLRQTGSADGVAEALMHDRACCDLVETTLAILDMFHVEPSYFLLNWMAGKYDA